MLYMGRLGGKGLNAQTDAKKKKLLLVTQEIYVLLYFCKILSNKILLNAIRAKANCVQLYTYTWPVIYITLLTTLN